MVTLDIVDYYLGAILPSPESVRVRRVDVSSICPRPLFPITHHSELDHLVPCLLVSTLYELKVHHSKSIETSLTTPT
jgi:hypothetical protein